MLFVIILFNQVVEVVSCLKKKEKAMVHIVCTQQCYVLVGECHIFFWYNYDRSVPEKSKVRIFIVKL